MTITRTFNTEVSQTPKQKAQDNLYDVVHNAVTYWTESQDITKGMTEREIALVQDQMNKLARSLYLQNSLKGNRTMKTPKGLKVWELIEFLENQDENDIVLLYTYDSRAGIVSYGYPCFKNESISRNLDNEPIECREGDGGNESAIVISTFI